MTTATALPLQNRNRFIAQSGMFTIAIASVVALFSLSFASSANAAEATVGLGTTASFSVLGGQTVTNTGNTTLSGDIGVAPGSSIVGFPPGLVGGATYAGTVEAQQAQSDLTLAYDNAAGRSSTATVTELGGQTLVSGVYTASTSMQLTGTVTLDAQGDNTAVFIFQAGSTLTTASSSTVALINGAQACNVFWQVGSSATIGTSTDFKGTIMALTSIAAQNGATFDGRALARNGEVTLDNNTFIQGPCDNTVPTTPPTTPATPDTPADVTTTDADSLASTGVNEEIWFIAAAAVVAAGLATYLIIRKRRRNIAQGGQGSAVPQDPQGL